MLDPDDYTLRADHLAHFTDRAGAWRRWNVMDAAASLEALGVSPDGFARVLALTEVTDCHCPAALTDVSAGFRIGVVPLDETGRSSGDPLGAYRAHAIVAWPKTQTQMRAQRRPR